MSPDQLLIEYGRLYTPDEREGDEYSRGSDYG
jgi:hypothetical protein